MDVREAAAAYLKKKNAESRDVKQAAAQYAKYKKINTDGVDGDYINQYLSDAQKYFKSISEPDESQYSTYQDLQSRRSVADAWLYKNKNTLTEESYLDAFEKLQTAGSAFDEMKSYWYQYDSEDDWKEAVRTTKEIQAERERKLGYDTAADEQEIAELNRMVDEYYASVSSGRNGLSGDEYARKVKDGENKLIKYFNDRYGDITSIEEIEALIASKQKNVDEIMQFQKYANAPQAEDFDYYADLGASYKNPSYGDVEKVLLGWRYGNDEDVKNIVTYSRENADKIGMHEAEGIDDFGDYLYSFMTDDEVRTYNYYLAKYGKKEASAYLDYLYNDLKDRHEGKIIQKSMKFADDHPVLGSAASIVTSLGSGLEYVVDAIKYKTGIDDEMDTNRMAIITNTMRGTVSEKVSWEIAGWDAGKFLYNTAMSGLDSAAAMFTPGIGGGAVLGLSAAAQGTNDALERGMGSEQAFWNGLVSGVFEGLFESVSISKFKALKEVNPETFKDIAKNIGKSMLTNASDETLTEIANIAYDTIANGEFANYTLEDLTNGAWVDALGQIAEAGGSGALMGVGFGAVGSASGYGQNKLQKRNTAYNLAEAAYNGDVEGMQELVNELKAADPQSKLATRLQTKLDAGEMLSGKELMKAAEQITAETEKKNQRGQTNSPTDQQNAAESDSAGFERERSLQEERRQEFEENLYREWGRNGTDFSSARAKLEKDGGAGMESAEAFRIYTEAKNEAAAEAKADRVRVTVTERGEDSSVVRVASVSGGNVTVELEGGSRINVSELTFDHPDTAVLYNGAARMNVASANAMIEGFETAARVGSASDALNYVRGWQEAYNSARYGIDLSESRFANTLTEEQLEAAKRAGKADRSRERANVGDTRTERRKGTLHRETDTSNLSKTQATAVEALERLAQTLGIDIYLYSESDSRHNGWYDNTDGSIHLNLAKELSAEGTL
ncbi:MAG: hypothetical protein ACI3YH_01380, partial [Eubacteriales bacterium]